MPDTPLVLLVDDDRDTREMYEIGLELLGLRLATAGSGREALASVEALAPQVIVTDLSLPDMDGFDLCRRMTEGAPARRPIIVLTGRSHGDEVARAMAAGAQRVLVKPCAPDDLAAAIHAVLADA